VSETSNALPASETSRHFSAVIVLAIQVAAIASSVAVLDHAHGHPRLGWGLASAAWIGAAMGLNNRSPAPATFFPGLMIQGHPFQARVGGLQFGAFDGGRLRWSPFLALALGGAAGGCELWISTRGSMGILRGLLIAACFVPLLANVLPEQAEQFKTVFVTPRAGEFERGLDRLASVASLYLLLGLIGVAAVLEAAGLIPHFNPFWFLVVILPANGLIKVFLYKRHL